MEHCFEGLEGVVGEVSGWGGWGGSGGGSLDVTVKGAGAREERKKVRESNAGQGSELKKWRG